MVSISVGSKTTIIFKLYLFNSSRTVGRDSFSFLAGITSVNSFIILLSYYWLYVPNIEKCKTYKI